MDGKNQEGIWSFIDIQQSNATAIGRFLRKTGLPLGALVALLI
jgi:hypothetical protein